MPKLSTWAKGWRPILMSLASGLTFYVAVVLAVTLFGLSKGGLAGLGMLGVPIVALVAPPAQAASILLPILVVQDAYSVWIYRRSWDKSNLIALMPGSLIGICLGYVLMSRVPEAAVSAVVGFVSIVFALRRLWLERATPAPARPRRSEAAGWFWGGLSGFTSMVSHSGTPPFQIYVLPQKLPRDVFIGTSVIFFAFTNWVKVAAYAALGQLTSENIKLSLLLMPLAIASTWIGVAVVRRVDTERFVRLVYLLLVVVGMKLIWNGLRL